MPAPVVQAKLSLTNYVASATILASAGGEQAGWPRANIKYPQQPFVPWKTATNTYNACILDFGVPRPLDLVIAVDLNYTDVRIHLDSDPAFATPVYSSGVIPVARNPWNTRYTAVHLFSPSQTQRYFYYEIPDQATTDGLAYFRTGGLWVGSSTALPRDIRWEERILRKEPHLDVALLGGGTQRVSTGRPCVEIRANRIAADIRAILVGLAIHPATRDARAGHDGRETSRPMLAAGR